MDLGQINNHTLKAGKISAGVSAQGGVKKQVEVQEKAAAKPAVTPSPNKQNGVTSTTTPEGFLSQKADSGVSVLTTDKGKDVSLPSGESFRWDDDGLQTLSENGAKGAKLVQNEDGQTLIEFQDKDQNTVRVEPESLVYEVLNKQKNLAQVYTPDGQQEVVAFGQVADPETRKITSYQNHAVFSADGELIAQEGFKDIAVDGRKFSFGVGHLRVDRQLAKPLPGQPPFAEVQAPAPSNNANQALAIFGDVPLGGELLAGVGTGALAGLAAAPAAAAPATLANVANVGSSNETSRQELLGLLKDPKWADQLKGSKLSELRWELESPSTNVKGLLSKAYEELEGGYTSSHTQRAAVGIGLPLAQAAGLSVEDQKTVVEAGQFYDIGKLAVPQEILDHPGKWPDDKRGEWFEKVSNHVNPELVTPMLKALDVSPKAQEAILQHHESPAGSYLKGAKMPPWENVSPAAKVLGMADTVDAMLNSKANFNRPEARPLSFEEVQSRLSADADKGKIDKGLFNKLFKEVIPAQAKELAAAEFKALPDISKDFFAGAGTGEVQFHETTSKVVMREEGNSRAFKLPGGEMFRTDGVNVELVGGNPDLKNVRLHSEGPDQFVVYSDKAGNDYTLDIANGDRKVSNRQGTLTQGFKADGTNEYTVRGSYSDAAGQPKQYAFTAAIDKNGQMVSKEGFDDFKLQGQSLMFTLPNGVETGRQLIQPGGQDINVAKKLVLSEGLSSQWGDALALADSFLNPAAAVAGAATATAATGVAANSPASQTRAPGQVRQQMADGGTVSTLPNGLKFYDGQEQYAVDAGGNRLPVQKTIINGGAAPADGSAPAPYLLTVRAGDGTDYSIANNDLSFIVQSADGMVHQLVGPNGKVMTSVMDQRTGNQHLHELDPMSGSTGSPGCRVDPRHPDRLFVDGSPQGSYQLPHPLFGQQQRPAPPNGAQAAMGNQGPAAGNAAAPDVEPNGMDPASGGQPLRDGVMAGPGGTQEGVRPGFWSRLKSAFTGENPWDRSYQHNNGQYGQRPYPGHYQQYDPVQAQFAQMQRSNNMMMMMNMGFGLMNQMQVMNMMFFPGGGFGMFGF